MNVDEVIKRAGKLAKPFRVADGERFRLSDVGSLSRGGQGEAKGATRSQTGAVAQPGLVLAVRDGAIQLQRSDSEAS